MTDGFAGTWQLRNGVRVPVAPVETPKTLCRVCGGISPVGLCRPCRDSSRKREHGSHNGFNQHQRRFEDPCQACSDAEKVYQGARYRRGSLRPVDLAWAEKNAVAWSWTFAAANARVTSTTN